VRTAKAFSAALVLALVAGQAPAADSRQGRILYETHCGGCHYPRVHERKTTQIESNAALRREVAKWAAQTPRRFTPGEVDDITEYLNRSHYRLAK